MMPTPSSRLENMEFEAHMNGITQCLLPKGLLTIEAGPRDLPMKDKTFAYFWQPELETRREVIDRATAAGFMGWKMVTPDEI